MAEPERTLPEFSDPPVIETVLGVQFLPLPKFMMPHLGLYWAKVRMQYPSIEIQPPLNPVVEMFDREARKVPSLGIEFVEGGDVRCWFIDETRTHLIQVQRDRFILNWRKVTGEEMYPRYARFKPRFVEEWQRFCNFLDQEMIGTPQVNQCEVTYVNHFEFGKEWKSYADLPRILTCWKGGSGSFLPDPELVRFNNRYVLPNQRGRLHVVLQPGIRKRDAKELLQLNLTARGKPESSSLEDIVKFFDLGHEWIVNGFTDLTSNEMHRLWGRTL